MPKHLNASDAQYKAALKVKDLLTKRYLDTRRETLAGPAVASPTLETEVPTVASVPSTHPINNVVGVGVGERIQQGRRTGELAVLVLVKKKYSQERIPKEHRLPRSLRGIPIDVIETGEFTAHVNPKGPVRPVVPGVSVGFAGAGVLLSAGTIGAVVRDPTGQRHLLSCNHVLARLNALPPGAAILQPGTKHGGKPDLHQVGTLAHAHPIDQFGDNEVDCAIAAINGDIQANPEILNIGRPTGVATAGATSVRKFGCETELRQGTVECVNLSIVLIMLGREIQFRKQILIKSTDQEPFSEGGDSGALVVETNSLKGVGLLIGGTGLFSVASHLTKVLDTLNVELEV